MLISIIMLNMAAFQYYLWISLCLCCQMHVLSWISNVNAIWWSARNIVPLSDACMCCEPHNLTLGAATCILHMLSCWYFSSNHFVCYIYRAYGSGKEDSPLCDVPGFENCRMKLLRHVSFVDCPVWWNFSHISSVSHVYLGFRFTDSDQLLC